MTSTVIWNLGIVIATTGRADVVGETLRSLAERTTVPEHVVVVGASVSDMPEPGPSVPFFLQRVVSPIKGLTFQRNVGVRHLPASVRYVVFIDDDVELHDNYCKEVEIVFSDCHIAGFMGCIISNGNGIQRKEARKLLDRYEIHPQMPPFGFFPNKWPGLYGCSMNIRRDLVEMEPFDENLPLYAIGEDTEIGFRLRRYGSVGGSGRCALVHLAIRSGRISEIGVGYAQVANYLYFAHKGIGYPRLRCYIERLIYIPLVNLACSVFPKMDRHLDVDRKGRFRGNCIALRDFLAGRVDPKRLLGVLSRCNGCER